MHRFVGLAQSFFSTAKARVNKGSLSPYVNANTASNFQHRMHAEVRAQSPQFKLLNDLSNRSVEAVVLDYSGTTTDALVFAPTVVFCDVFKEFGVPISTQEARVPMGLRKDLHIEAISEMQNVSKRWQEVYGRAPNDEDVDKMFARFVPLQEQCLPTFSEVIPGTRETLAWCRDRQIQIGATTGFTRSMVDILDLELKGQGVEFDTTVAGDEVQNGARPSPHMIYKNMDRLNLFHPELVVKVDDTVTGVGEGLAAGCWTVVVTAFSNEVGKKFNSYEQFAAMSKQGFESFTAESRERLARQSGAHYCASSVLHLREVIEDINRRLALGEVPTSNNLSLEEEQVEHENKIRCRAG